MRALGLFYNKLYTLDDSETELYWFILDTEHVAHFSSGVDLWLSHVSEHVHVENRSLLQALLLSHSIFILSVFFSLSFTGAHCNKSKPLFLETYYHILE